MNARTNRWWTITLALACAAWVPAQELAPRYMVDVERWNEHLSKKVDMPTTEMICDRKVWAS